MIQSKFGEDFIRDHHGYKKWQCISSPWQDIARTAGFYRENSKFKVGRREKVLFWEDCWISERPLKRIFPYMFRLSLVKRAKVQELWNGSTWDLGLRRGLFDREIGEWIGMYSLNSQCNLNNKDNGVGRSLRARGCLLLDLP